MTNISAVLISYIFFLNLLKRNILLISSNAKCLPAIVWNLRSGLGIVEALNLLDRLCLCRQTLVM